jgi:hypothetical protein
MKAKRFQQYLDNKKQGKGIQHKQEIASHSDQKIDEDFKGYPGNPAKESVIKPKTATEKKTAQVDVKDGEKMKDTSGKKGIDEQESDGSGGAFGGTEDVKE